MSEQTETLFPSSSTCRLPPGIWRGLSASSTSTRLFTILAFDQRGNYLRMLPDGISFDTAARIKQEVVRVLSNHASAVLLDPIYGLDAALQMSGHSGLLMALEKTGYSGDSTYRQVDFIPGWNVQKIRYMGAAGVKLLVYYHPESGALAEEIENCVHEVSEAAHRVDLPLFVEPLCYSLDSNISKSSPEFARERPQVIIETTRRLSRSGADVLKLEFPIDTAFDNNLSHWSETCARINEASVVPWVLLSAGVDFDTFQQQVEIACKAGASGFIGGRAIWKECITMSESERQHFLQTTAAARLDALTQLAEQYARPWTDFYQPPVSQENWFESYHPGKSS